MEKAIGWTTQVMGIGIVKEAEEIERTGGTKRVNQADLVEVEGGVIIVTVRQREQGIWRDTESEIIIEKGGMKEDIEREVKKLTAIKARRKIEIIEREA